MVIKYPVLAAAAYNFYATLFREGRPDDKYKNLSRPEQQVLNKALETGDIPSNYDNDLILAIKCAREMYHLSSLPDPEPKVESDTKLEVPVSNR